MTIYKIQEASFSGQVIERTLTDPEAQVYFAPQVEITSDKAQITSDGVDFCTLSLQLKSVPLSNDARVNIALVHKIMLQIADTVVELVTNNSGFVQHEMSAVADGTYSVKTLNLTSNTLVITAV